MNFLFDPYRIRAGAVFYGVALPLYGYLSFYVETTVSPHFGDFHLISIERILLFAGPVGPSRQWAAWKIQQEKLLYDEPYMALHQEPRKRLPATLLGDLVMQAMTTMINAQKWSQSFAPQIIHRLLQQLQPLLEVSH